MCQTFVYVARKVLCKCMIEFLALMDLWVIKYTFCSLFKSQLDFSLTSGPADQGISTSQADSKAIKAPHTSQLSKSTPGTKVRKGAYCSSFHLYVFGVVNEMCHCVL